MKIEFINGVNDAIKGIYNNPYSQQAKENKEEYFALFMHYHNGHNTGSNKLREEKRNSHVNPIFQSIINSL